jgi:uncharacterized protein YndB with AHSA1/START domain
VEVTRDVLLDAGADEVWRLLSDDAELSTWLGDDVHLDLRPGGSGVVGDGEAQRHAVVEEVVDGRRLVLSWWSDHGGDVSRVSFDLEQVGDRTRLTVVETAPPPGATQGRRGDAGGRRNGGARCCAGSAIDIGSAWDERLLGLELRLLSRAGAVLARR